MNLELFNRLMIGRGCPAQNPSEWRMFLEACDMYLKKHKIKNPVVVELGSWNNRQKKFYEQLLGAEYIGIDISKKKSKPDIQGNTHDPKTLETLRAKLGRKLIDILFIDSCHWYEDVKKDFEMYSPLCSGIIAFHDINNHRYNLGKENQVWKFWDELKIDPSTKNFSFNSIEKTEVMGIGVMIKR